MNIEYSAFSEQGRRRDNQDHLEVFVDNESGRAAFILCDGMGGHAHGALAARVVSKSLIRDVRQNPPEDEDDIQRMISRATWTLDTITQVYGGAMMGTTMVMAYINGDKVTVIHCGDSRCYVYDKDRNMKYVTSDHNDGDYMGSSITRCFFSGNPEMAKPDIRTFTISPGDRLLLCSDGVYPSMAPEILRDRMMDDRPLETIIDTFKFMCEKFSDDNYSAILLKVD